MRSSGYNEYLHTDFEARNKAWGDPATEARLRQERKVTGLSVTPSPMSGEDDNLGESDAAGLVVAPTGPRTQAFARKLADQQIGASATASMTPSWTVKPVTRRSNVNSWDIEAINVRIPVFSLHLQHLFTPSSHSKTLQWN